MNTKSIILIVSISLVMMLGLASCAAAPSITTASSLTGTTSSTSAAANTTISDNNVSIENFKFNPETLTIKAGTTVTWTNNDSAAHNIKSDSFNSPSMAQGKTFSFTFNNKGTFDYICGVHPSMKGKIIVE